VVFPIVSTTVRGALTGRPPLFVTSALKQYRLTFILRQKLGNRYARLHFQSRITFTGAAMGSAWVNKNFVPRLIGDLNSRRNSWLLQPNAF
jgi:hypothetical protein